MQAWFGRIRTRSPTRKDSPASTPMTPCSSDSRAMRLFRPRIRPWPAPVGRRGSLESVFEPASQTARSAAGALTIVATTVMAQSSSFALPSCTCEKSL